MKAKLLKQMRKRFKCRIIENGKICSPFSCILYDYKDGEKINFDFSDSNCSLDLCRLMMIRMGRLFELSSYLKTRKKRNLTIFSRKYPK